METKEYRTVDKSSWPAGDWQDEPDKIQWPDPATGLPCLVVRGPHGALCGYVGVPPEHPWHGKGYDATIGACTEECDQEHDDHYSHSINARTEVHGGLTFADKCHPRENEAQGICHTPGPGEPDHVWWFGFDCAHAGDFCPGYARLLEGFEGFERGARHRGMRAATMNTAVCRM